jgi:small subunit ribosomal protein S16
VGRKKIVQYRVVAADSRMRRDGRFIETVGFYNPQTNPKTFNFNTERVMYWIKNGAQPTVTVKNLLQQDRFFDKMEGASKGIATEQLVLERKPERVRKPKTKKEKK